VQNTNGGEVLLNLNLIFYESGTYQTGPPEACILDSFNLDIIDLDGTEFFDVVIPASGSYDLDAPAAITVSTVGAYKFKGPKL
jgi:hypothetical protein